MITAQGNCQTRQKNISSFLLESNIRLCKNGVNTSTFTDDNLHAHHTPITNLYTHMGMLGLGALGLGALGLGALGLGVLGLGALGLEMCKCVWWVCDRLWASMSCTSVPSICTGVNIRFLL